MIEMRGSTPNSNKIQIKKGKIDPPGLQMNKIYIDIVDEKNNENDPLEEIRSKVDSFSQPPILF